jgi:SAM-dependent methyltransferase
MTTDSYFWKEKPLPEYKFNPDSTYLQANNKNLYKIFSQGMNIDYTNAKVLDFGCNQGNYIIHARDIVKPENYVGIDLNFPSIEVAKTKYPDYKFVHYNKWHISFNPTGDKNVKLTDFVDNDFDVVIAFSVLTHTTIDQTRQILDELYQVIKPGGSILFTIWLDDQFQRVHKGFQNVQKNHTFSEYQKPDFNSVLYWTDYTDITTDVEDLDINICGSLCTFWKPGRFRQLFPKARPIKMVTESLQVLYRLDKPI